MTIIAVANNKGGSDKTTTTTELARSIARDGYNVAIIDMDFGNNSATQAFVRYHEQDTNERGYYAQIKDRPAERSVFALMLSTMALERYAFRVPFEQIIADLPKYDRYKVSRVNPATIYQDTINYYHLDLNRLGDIILVPNGGEWAQVWQQITASHLQRGGADPYDILRLGIERMDATRQAQGLTPIHFWLIDSPGEGDVTTLIGRAADHIVFSFNMTMWSVGGMENVARQFIDIRHLRGGKPYFDLAIPSRFNDDPAEGQVEWLQHVVKPRLDSLGIPLSQPVPFSMECERAGRKDLLDWEYAPLDAPHKVRDAIYQHTLRPLWGIRYH